MNKVININFQGSIIPIEEAASETLRQYIHSLRNYFAGEEGRDEIISDIESRIAELFLERLKKGASCITEPDLQEIITGIGRPEDFDAAAEEKQHFAQSAENTTANDPGIPSPKRLSRSANNQVIGGVAAGLGHYLNIDASIMRVLFILCMMAGFGFLVYIVLWAVLPQQPLPEHTKRRLFRNPDEKKLGGVAAGIAAYFNIDVWVPRLIFMMPLLLGAVGSIANNSWLDSDLFPGFVFNGFGGTLLVIYFVLWWVLPEAHSAAEKLQMRGRKVDLASIKSTINDEMQQFKGKASEWGREFSTRTQEQAKKMQQELGGAAREAGTQAMGTVRRSGSGLGKAIGVLAKVFVFTFLGIIILSLLLGLASVITAIITGNNVRDFLLEGERENALLWCTIIFFIAVPIISMLMWLIRALRGVRSRNRYMGYIFGALWFFGWVSLFALIHYFAGHFTSKAKVQSTVTLNNPSEKLYLKVSVPEDEYFIRDWRSKDVWPKLNQKEDSIFTGNIKVKITQARDTLYHLHTIRIANGKDHAEAERHAGAIRYQAFAQDSILYIDKYMSMSRKEKFRNQQVLLVLEVPLGKKIEIDRKINDFDWYDVSVNTGSGFNIQVNDDEQDEEEKWHAGKEYRMTSSGLVTP